MDKSGNILYVFPMRQEGLSLALVITKDFYVTE